MAPLEGDLHQPNCQRGVVHTGRSGRLGEAGVGVEIAVGVHVDDERHTFRRQTQIDPAVVPALERREGGERGLYQPGLGLFIQGAAP
jgi:hypothetical protein